MQEHILQHILGIRTSHQPANVPEKLAWDRMQQLFERLTISTLGSKHHSNFTSGVCHLRLTLDREEANNLNVRIRKQKSRVPDYLLEKILV